MTDELQAAKLLIIAISEIEHGSLKAAKDHTTTAIEFMDRAMNSEAVGQQQQQIQPKKKEDK